MRLIDVLGRMFKSSQENYGYLNASLRARSSTFLSVEDYASIARGDLNGLEQFLLESRYSQSYREQLAVTRQALLGRVENALANSACNELLRIKGLAKGEPAMLLDIMFSRADIMNSRLIFRALSTGSVTGPPPRWHYYGALKKSFYDDLWVKSSSTVEIMEKCYSNDHPFSTILAESVQDLNKGFELQMAERTLLIGILNQLYRSLNQIYSVNSKRVRDFLGLTTDTWNIGIWLRKRTGYKLPALTSTSFINGGAWLTIDRLNSSKAMSDLVHGTPWRGVVRGIEEESPRDFQRALSMYVWKWQMDLFRADPLGIEVAMGYSAKQLVEWENLNLLSVGMAMGLPSDEMMRRLIPV